MKQSHPIESERQNNNRSHLAASNASPVSQAFVDNRESTAIQRQLMAKMANSPQAIAQRKLSEQINNSPRMLAQRQQIAKMSGNAVQRVEGEEELLQGKFKTIQRVEEEELLQGKFGVAQRVEEEELLQGKFSPIQRVEEEELLQGKFDAVQRVEEEELLQGKFNTAQLAQTPAEKANNTGLPDNLKQGIENLSGMSMDNVQVHYNSSKPAQLNALAYAQGTDIHLGAGQEKHLPHEAWHVVQQAQGRVKPTMQMKDGVPVNDDQALEHEADVMGAKALQMHSAVIGAFDKRACPNMRSTQLRAVATVKAAVSAIQMVASETKKVRPSAASINELDATTWGYCEDERIKVAWHLEISDDLYHVKLDTITGEYSVQSQLVTGVNEVTGPGGNTTQANYQSQVLGLGSLGDAVDPWYMLAAVDAHEHVHETSLGVALDKEKSNIEKIFSGITASSKLSLGVAKERIGNSQAFRNALRDGRTKWDNQYVNRIAEDHTGRTPSAERRVVNPMIKKINEEAKKENW